MADGFAQATRQPALVNLHTSAGTGNGIGSIMTAFLNKTPLIITAGQQMREMILCEPMLTNRDETMLPRPYVKWAYQPARAQDVPGAIMRAYALALQPPAGPVYVSIPLDDWDQPVLGRAVVRTVSTRFAPIVTGCASLLSGFRTQKSRLLSTDRRSSGAAVGMRALRLRKSFVLRCFTRQIPSGHPFPKPIRCSKGCSRSLWGL
jgi:Thiamine pyrophosphate enzyme, N-terminal TPP binding domain